MASREDRERDLERELRSHLDLEAEQQQEAGFPDPEARYAAHRALGNEMQIKEEVREMWGWTWFDRLSQDLRYALRTLRKSPGFTATAVLSLALGIGANTAIFSLVDALLLRWLPVEHARDLVEITWTIRGTTSDSFSYPAVKALAEHKELFAGLCGFSGSMLPVGPSDNSERTPGAWVAGDYYGTLGLRPAAGRLLMPEDDRPGATPVIVLSDGYWQRKFNRSPAVIGRSVLLNGHPVTVAGVAPPGFTGASVGDIADITMPMAVLPVIVPDRASMLAAGNQWIRVLAWPQAAISREQLQARLRVIWPGIMQVSVDGRTIAKRREAELASIPKVISGSTGWSALRGQYRDPLVLLMRLVALVLLIACANVANLLLARASARQREIAVRLAIGASRRRLIRQLLTESLLLASLGAVAGLILARFASQALLQLVSGSPAGIPLDMSLNWRVLGFTTAVAAVTGLLFGVAPALRATAAGPGPALKSDTRTTAGSRSWLASGLVVAQVALSLVAIVGAGLLVGTLRNLEAVNPGFRHEGILLADIDSRKTGIDPRSPQLAMFYRDLLDAVRRTSGVQAASLSNNTPLSGGYWTDSVAIAGRLSTPDDEAVHMNQVSPGFFETMQTPLAAGRDFTAHDDAGSIPVAIVNEAFVKRYLSGMNPLGERVSVRDSTRFQNMEIVGVAQNAVGSSLRLPSPPTLYMPLFQAPQIFPTLEVYASGSLSSVSAALTAELKPRLPGAYLNIRGLTRQVEGAMRRERLMAVLAGFFGILALLLSFVGLYGLLAYVVAQRTGEIGIRMALGAQQRQMLWMVLRNALQLAGAGVVIGIPAAWWASRFVAKMVYGMKATDPATMLGAAAILGAAALAAGLLPARRAARVDPMVALRYE